MRAAIYGFVFIIFTLDGTCEDSTDNLMREK